MLINSFIICSPMPSSVPLRS